MGLLPTVLSPEGLQHIAEHKYVAGKYSPLDNLLNPYWTKGADALPIWLAPNLVTLLGFLPMVASYCLCWSASPDYSSAPTRLLALFTTLALFFYQTMDAIDGKQARRTGSSSPLGQLFDHGCDCLACLSHHSMAGTMLLPGPSMWSMGGLVGLQGSFFLAQWSEYHTGVLRTSFGPVGVTEIQFGLMFCGLFVTAAGPENIETWFKAPVQMPWSAVPEPLGFVGAQAWCVFGVLLSAVGIQQTIPAARARGTLDAALKQLVSVVGHIVLMCCWRPEAFKANPRNIVFLSGLLFFWYTAKMILFSMAKMHYPAFQLDSLLPYAAVVAASWVLKTEQFHLALSAGILLFGVRVALWLLAVLTELKAKLNIYTFTLRKRDA